jgi:hypothetical protein
MVTVWFYRVSYPTEISIYYSFYKYFTIESFTFRCISSYLHNTEVYHENIRHEVTNTLSKNKEFYSQLIDGVHAILICREYHGHSLVL